MNLNALLLGLTQLVKYLNITTTLLLSPNAEVILCALLDIEPAKSKTISMLPTSGNSSSVSSAIN
jgi:hypothetical protein